MFHLKTMERAMQHSSVNVHHPMLIFNEDIIADFRCNLKCRKLIALSFQPHVSHKPDYVMRREEVELKRLDL